ncbi:small integral membrane protein 8-like [Macrosteles quadrilineatus]|uniref:small integral membrane protein 8-like n=1 Tax=Macrosteles quadrilineatus TaxID=74068 RepID=UPI0023E2A525|nr:small integral membrane protein 8-like [Macrosteles quadrilineatus]XP_054264824.1 small integral membrane protein 8-like [Macrosteles quadrilineatus]XP_054264825.1 small integral membrane protein 8-like [Macrosteles quadrilineatus]
MTEKEAKPGDGIKSLKTSSVFRVVNFELYATPNRVVMGLGLLALAGCVSYIGYMRHKYAGMGYYPAIDNEGKEVYKLKQSKWD